MSVFQYGMLVEQVATVTTSAGTTTLVNTSKQVQYFTGTSTQTIKLPATTAMSVGQFFKIYNASTGNLTIQFQDASSFVINPTIFPNGSLIISLVSTGTTNGTWAVQAESSMPLFAARYTGTNISVNGGSQPLNYSVKDYDDANAVTTGTSWKFTAPIPGKYRITGAYVTQPTGHTAGGVFTLSLYKNNSLAQNIGQYTSQNTGLSQNFSFNGSGTILLAAGDFIDLRIVGLTAETSTAVTADNSIAIERVCN